MTQLNISINLSLPAAVNLEKSTEKWPITVFIEIADHAQASSHTVHFRIVRNLVKKFKILNFFTRLRTIERRYCVLPRAFLRSVSYEIAYCCSVAQYMHFLSAEQC